MYMLKSKCYNKSYWNKAEQKINHCRKCIGKLNLDTYKLIPNSKKSITTGLNNPILL